MAVVMLIDVLRDFGVANYIVQEKSAEARQVRAAFSITLGLSLFCAAGLLLAAAPLATFYGEPGLRRLIPLFAANFLLLPFSMPSLTLLRRDMAFEALAGINIAAALVNLVTVVALATLGFGFMSLGWATLATSVARTVGAWAVRPCFWAFRPSLRDWRNLAGFGGYSTATAVINLVHDYLPQLLIGRLLDFSAVGLLGRATSLCQLPDRLVISALNPVICPPWRTRRVAGSPEAGLPAGPLVHVGAAMAHPAMPRAAGRAGGAGPSRRSVGRGRTVAAPHVARLPRLVPGLHDVSHLVALGRVRDTLSMSLISLPPSIILILVAAPFGLQAVAATQFINAPLQVFVAICFIRRRIDLSWHDRTGGARQRRRRALRGRPSGDGRRRAGRPRPRHALARRGGRRGWRGGRLARRPVSRGPPAAGRAAPGRAVCGSPHQPLGLTRRAGADDPRSGKPSARITRSTMSRPWRTTAAPAPSSVP